MNNLLSLKSIFKISSLALGIFNAFHTNAALYDVVLVEPTNITSEYKIASASAITQGDITNAATMPTGCFANATRAECTAFKLAGEVSTISLIASQVFDGIGFRAELPYAMDSSFDLIQEYDDVEYYCNSQLGYSICTSWAALMWSGIAQLYDLNDTNSISSSFVEGLDIDNKYNTVLNALTTKGSPIGNQSVLATSGNEKLLTANQVIAPFSPQMISGNYSQARAWTSDDTYIAGSISTTYGTNYTSNAAIWGDGVTKVIDWASGVARANNSDRLASASMRDFVIINAEQTLYGVGYNSYDSNNNYLSATIFKADLNSGLENATFTSIPVSGALAGYLNDHPYSNSVVQAVNNNKLAVGEAKLTGQTPLNGAAANRLFIIEDLDNPTAQYLSSDIFFNGVGGKIGGLNNYNEIVGQIDFSNEREVNGVPRAKKAFIYPHSFAGSNDERMAIFKNKAWYLDDLTNDNIVQGNGNNQYRIIDANDINDAGVIAATASYCAGGYRSTSMNATCEITEKIVAVKLIPKENTNAQDANITPRSVDQKISTRKGASSDVWMLFALLMLAVAQIRRV